MSTMSERVSLLLKHFNGEVTEEQLRDYAMKLVMQVCSLPHEVGPPIAVTVSHRGASSIYPGDPNEFMLSGDSRIGHAARIIITDISPNLVSVVLSTETGNMFYRNVIRHWDDRIGQCKGYAEQWMQLRWGEAESESIMASRLRNLKEYLWGLVEQKADQKIIDHTRLTIETTVDQLDRLYGRGPI